MRSTRLRIQYTHPTAVYTDDYNSIYIILCVSAQDIKNNVGGIIRHGIMYYNIIVVIRCDNKLHFLIPTIRVRVCILH